MFRSMLVGDHALWFDRSLTFEVFFGTYGSVIKILSPEENPDPLQSALGGSISGAASWSVVFPMDVIKTRVQVSPEVMSVKSAVIEVYTIYGVRGFYRGW